MTAGPQTLQTQRLALAVTLLWCSLGVGVFMAFLQRDIEIPGPLKGGVALFLLLAYVLWAVLIVKVKDCRNWARIALLIMVGGGTISDLSDLQKLFTRSQLEGVLSVIQSLLQLSAVAILFTSPASLCFRRQPACSES